MQSRKYKYKYLTDQKPLAFLRAGLESITDVMPTSPEPQAGCLPSFYGDRLRACVTKQEKSTDNLGNSTWQPADLFEQLEQARHLPEEDKKRLFAMAIKRFEQQNLDERERNKLGFYINDLFLWVHIKI